MPVDVAQTQSVFQQWLDSLKTRDPALHAELVERLNSRMRHPETVASPGDGITLERAAPNEDLGAVSLETIVREGRPALLIRDNRIEIDTPNADQAARIIVERLRTAIPKIEPLIPLVGRIDVANYPGNLPYAGTGWLVGPNLVVTNRHVAELIARSNDGQFVFRPGRFGDALQVSIDYRHELNVDATVVSKVLRVLWIESDATKADIAFLEVAPRSFATGPQYISLAESDAAASSEVAVIGYPARAPAHIIPNQTWMEQIYGANYDIKRIAPGLMGALSRGWATHDCTTLGGNSGSVVVNMATGQAVALHFAGLYMIENYAVPASTIRTYLNRKPWLASGPELRSDHPALDQSGGAGAGGENSLQTRVSGPHSLSLPAGALGQFSVTIPLTITVSVGTPVDCAPKHAGTDGASETPRTLNQIARKLFQIHRTEGMISAWPGYQIRNGRLSEARCLVVSADPRHVNRLQESLPRTFANYPIEVWPAILDDQLGLTQQPGVATEAATTIRYNDDDRTGGAFSFATVDEEMTLVLHVGPERSWTVLSDFLQGTGPATQLVSAIYQFHSAHIADAIEAQLSQQSTMTLVTAQESRNPSNGNIRSGDFDRSARFAKWRDDFQIDQIYVPLGQNGLVANAYHIKVTVRDGSRVWLSSGNWTRSSQPLIPSGDLNNPVRTNGAGNREWHVVIENQTLAQRFQNHILADYERSLDLGGTLEGLSEEPLVDVPNMFLESLELEAAPARVLKPLLLTGRFRVKPLLTPDHQGRVYCEAVLQLIRSASRQLLFQNQYIKMSGAESGFLKDLVDALAEKARVLPDCRILLRTASREETHFNLTRLKDRGVDVNRQVRLLANTHTKGIIVDGTQVLIGSHNWSSSGVTLNRDASLIFDDARVAGYFQEAFELDWNRANEPNLEAPFPESVRPAVGPNPPSGFTRMRLAEFLEG